MRTFTSLQRMPSWMLILLVMSTLTPLLIIFGVGYNAFMAYRETGVFTDELAEMRMASIIILAVNVGIYMVLFLPPLKVRIDPVGVYYYCFPYLRKGKQITWNEISEIKVVDVSPLGDFGGWGYRKKWNGQSGYILKGGPAIEVAFVDSTRTMTFTIENPQQAERVIAHYLKKAEN